LDLIFSNPLNEAVVAKNDLSNILDFQFWYDSPRARKFCEAIGGVERAVSEHTSNLRCVASDKEANRFKIIESLWCPLT
jgi:hypothetical protein